MRVPAAREVREKPARPLEIAAFLEETDDHRRELAHLDVLQAQLPADPHPVILAFRRGQLVALRVGKDPVFLGGGVAPQLGVERSHRASAGLEVSRRHGRDERAEELVEPAVLAFEGRGETP